MADQDVNIVGVNGQQVPDWATEQTLEAMLNKVEELVRISKSQRDVLKQGIKSGGGGSGSGRQSKEEKEKNKRTKEASNLLGELSSDLAETAGNFRALPKPMQQYLANLKKTNKAGFAMAAGVLAIANQATKAVVSIGEQVSALRDLSDSGVRLEGSFMEMSRGLAEVGMTVAEFGEIAGKYSRVMSMQGFKSLSELSSKVNETAGGFAKWGMTQKEGIEVAAELLDQQRRAGLFRTIDQQRESKRIEEVMNRLTAYSKVLNVSREAMLEGQKAMLSEADVRFRLSQMTAEERANFEKGIGGTAAALTAAGDDYVWIATLMREAAVNQINEQSDAWRDLAGAGFTDLANKLAGMADVAAATGKELTMEEVTETMRAYGQNNKDFLESMFKAGGASRDYAIKIANASLTAEEAEDMRARLAAQGVDMQADAVDKNVQTMTALQNEINQFVAAIEHMRVKAFMDLIGAEAEGGIKGLTSALDSLTKKMLEFSDGPHLSNFRDFVTSNWVEIGAGIMGAYALVKLAFANTAAGMTGFSGSLKSLGMGLGRLGVAGATLVGSYMLADKVLNDWLGLSTGIGDLVDKALGRNQDLNAPVTGGRATPDGPWEADISHLSPDQQKVVTDARRRRAERAATEEANNAANATATPASTTESSTATQATPTMSEAEIASLSVGERQAYLLAELLRVNKRMARGITGDSFA